MTDWGAITKEKGDYYQCANNGNDLIMPGDGSVVKQLLNDLKTGRLNRKAAQISVERILRLVMKSDYVGQKVEIMTQNMKEEKNMKRK